MSYTTEEEQVEAIKKWWKENGLSIAAGVVLGFSLLLGWQAWQQYNQQKAETASAQYEQVLLAVEQNQADRVREAANVLLSDYSDSPYASLAALALAKQSVAEKQLDAAQAHLQWVLDNSALPELVHVARTRKAQLLLEQGKLADVQKLLSVADKGAFSSVYAELEGDVALAKKEVETARIAYQKALSDENLNPSHKNLLQLKLDNLGQPADSQIMAAAPKVPTQEEANAAKEAAQTVEEGLIDPTALMDAIATPSTAETAAADVLDATGTPSTVAAVTETENSTADETALAPIKVELVEDAATATPSTAIQDVKTVSLNNIMKTTLTDEAATPSTAVDTSKGLSLKAVSTTSLPVEAETVPAVQDELATASTTN